MKKRKTKSKKQQKSLIFPSIVLFVLIGLVVFTSNLVLRDVATSISINKREKATIIYTNQSDEIITISNEVLLNDEDAINSDNKYNFEIKNKNSNKNYTISINKVNSQIEDKYIKFYLTDIDNNKLNGFSKPIKLSELREINNNKILYRGTLKSNKAYDKAEDVQTSEDNE